MKNKIFLISLIFLILTGCAGISSKGVFGTGVSVAFDPRSLGTQIDDSVMQKNLATRLALRNKSYILNVSTKVLDGKIFVTGKVDAVSYTHLRAHETDSYLVCRLLLEKSRGVGVGWYGWSFRC